MDFQDQIKQLATRVDKVLPQIHTEEATKNALIMPFIQILGYDVFDPMEVCPEFTADLGIKKGEKVDYAIFLNEKPIILVECKHHIEKLDPHNSQLFRYFHVSDAKFGLLTNGKLYRFYTDINEPNKMDEKPFFEFDITQAKEAEIEELKKFHKSYFDIDSISNAASELKYLNEVKTLLFKELNNPSEDFTRYFAKQAYPSIVTSKILEQFNPITKRAFNQIVNDLINERLKTALNKNETEGEEAIGELAKSNILPKGESEIVTTEEEKEGFLIVKSILRQKLSTDRITYRDAKTYFAIILDDNNRKPLARLWFNSKNKHIGLFDQDKNESKHPIEKLDDIYNFSDQLLTTVDYYLEKSTS